MLRTFFSSIRRRRFSSSVDGGASDGSRIIARAALDGELRVFLIAGEVSGDSIAARLMSSLTKVSPLPLRFAGVGGVLMCKEGLQSLFPMEDISVMGIGELLPHLNKFRIKLKEATEAALVFRPHVVVTVDSKGFSFRFLKQLRARYDRNKSSPLHVHYVAPSFWAWKDGETCLSALSKFVDHILCILPFEEEVCRKNGLPATYVGYPLLEDAKQLDIVGEKSKGKLKERGNNFRREHGISSGTTVITLLPGSRLQEVRCMLPIFLQTMELVKGTFPDMSLVIPIAPNRDVETYIRREMQRRPLSAVIVPGESLNSKYEAYCASRAALCTSGTAVMELQLAYLPCVVAYRAHFLTELVIKLKTKLQFMSLPNILLDSAVIPEVLFKDCTSENLAIVLSKVMLDNGAREKQVTAAAKVFSLLLPQENYKELPSDSYSPSIIAASKIICLAEEH